MGDAAAVVLVDMDGVLADFDGRVVGELLATCPQLGAAATRSVFHLTRAFPDYRASIEAVTSRREFFTSLPLVEGALEGWKRIEKAGFAPRVCSSPLSVNRWSVQAKREWLARYLGKRVADDAFIDDDKASHAGIALIDDKPQIANSDRACWQHVVFDASYNRQLPEPRLLGWHDPRLDTILADAQNRYLSRRAG